MLPNVYVPFSYQRRKVELKRSGVLMEWFHAR